MGKSLLALIQPAISVTIFCVAITACGGAKSSSAIEAANSSNILTNTAWTRCHLVRGVGKDFLYERDKVAFTAEDHFIIKAEAFASDSNCTKILSPDEVQNTFSINGKPSTNITLGYHVGASPDANGHYDMDVIYGREGIGTNVYSKMAMDDHTLRISDVCNFEDVAFGTSCQAINGRSPDQRADRLNEGKLLFEMTR